MQEIDRAYEVCAARGPFHAEHVFRECNVATQDTLSIKSNRNVLGMVFRMKRKTRRFRLTGAMVPATHARSKGRLIPLWEKVA